MVAGTNETNSRLQSLSYHRLSISGDFLGSSTVQGQMMHPEADDRARMYWCPRPQTGSLAQPEKPSHR